ncbi:hypothetical protein ACJMK2_043689 [Sinanodonta woodiana]|uniref:Major facilitator superfamily (MFS) profile domain-containing protein n=1 Tax=Sinanodonta woodiana TaxID=1069815 RepID=A0ABD3VXQ2_SINWO
MACAQRYWVVLMGFMGLLLSIGYRAVFSLVIVHVNKAKHNLTDEDDSIFATKCTTTGTNRNLEVVWQPGVNFLFQTAYFISSTLTQFPGGILAVRFSAKRVCGLSVLLSGLLLTVMPTAILYHDGVVFAIRIVQGVIEGVTVPALNGVIAAWAPKSEKSRLITISYAGAYLSTAVAFVVSGACMCYVTWYAALILYGGLGTLWSIVWLCTVYDSPSLCPCLGEKEKELYEREGNHVKPGSKATSAKVPWKQIFTSLPVSAVFVGAFCRNWIFSMLIVMEPQYLKDVFHMSTANIGLFSSIPHILMTIVVIFGGFMFDHLIKAQIISTTVARKLAQCIGFGVEAGCILGLYFISDWKVAIILLSVGVAISGLAISGKLPGESFGLVPTICQCVDRDSTLGGIRGHH